MLAQRCYPIFPAHAGSSSHTCLRKWLSQIDKTSPLPSHSLFVPSCSPSEGKGLLSSEGSPAEAKTHGDF